MRAHLATPDDLVMGPASATYTIRVNGHLGATLLSAFPALTWEWQGPETVLTGLLDQPGLYGVLAGQAISEPGAGTGLASLTPQQRQIAQLAAAGHTNK
jgi:hypothetical protein